MPGLRSALALAAAVGALLVPAVVSPSPAAAAYPETVKVKDSRTSADVVDISQVRLDASWYWDSEQSLSVTVPHGFRTGHVLTVWFDIDQDGAPDGHYRLELGKPRKPGGKYLKLVQGFRVGGGWTDGGRKVRCTDSEDFQPVSEVRKGQRSVSLGLDLWSCLQTPNPPGLDSGAWRTAVKVAKGKRADMAPNGRRWSPYVAGWGPCDPSGGDC